MLWGLLLTFVLCAPSDAVIRIQLTGRQDHEHFKTLALMPVKLPKTPDLRGLQDWLAERGNSSLVGLLNFSEATPEELVKFHSTFFENWPSATQLEQILVAIERSTVAVTPLLSKIESIIYGRLGRPAPHNKSSRLPESRSSLTDGSEFLGSVESPGKTPNLNRSGINIPYPKKPFHHPQMNVASSLSGTSFTCNDGRRPEPKDRNSLSIFTPVSSNLSNTKDLVKGLGTLPPSSNRESPSFENICGEIDCIFGEYWEDTDTTRPLENGERGEEKNIGEKIKVEDSFSSPNQQYKAANLEGLNQPSVKGQIEDPHRQVPKVSTSIHRPRSSKVPQVNQFGQQRAFFGGSNMANDKLASYRSFPHIASAQSKPPPMTQRSETRPFDDEDDNLFDEKTLGVFSFLVSGNV